MTGRGWRALAYGAAMVLAVGAGAQSPRQKAFDAAQAAFDREDWATAAAGFEPLLAPPGKASRTDGMIRTRFAESLSHLRDEDRAEMEGVRATGEFPAGERAANGRRLISRWPPIASARWIWRAR